MAVPEILRHQKDIIYEVIIMENKEAVTAESNIIETVQAHPEIMQVFAKYGLGCVGCMAAQFESIGEGAAAHGLDVPALIADINKCIAANK